jgi:hypothetical protein
MMVRLARFTDRPDGSCSLAADGYYQPEALCVK